MQVCSFNPSASLPAEAPVDKELNACCGALTLGVMFVALAALTMLGVTIAGVTLLIMGIITPNPPFIIAGVGLLALGVFGFSISFS